MTIKRVMALLMGLMLCLNAPVAWAAQMDDARGALATRFLEDVLGGNVQEADAVMTDEMRDALDAQGGLDALSQALVLDEAPEYEAATGAAQGAYYVVSVPVLLSGQRANAVISVDEAGLVAGLMFLPIAFAEEEALAAGLTEEAATVDAGEGYPLGGTLTLPDGAADKLPAVLLVWGSGDNDRDETVGANKVFAQLANMLGERVIATLRFDKRTFTYPEVKAARGYSVQDEYMRDVLAAVQLLQGDPRIDAQRVFILGHSQGGMLAPRFVDAGADVAGLILLAGTPRNLSDVIYDQQMDALGELAANDEARAVYDDMRDEARAVYAGTEEEALDRGPLYAGSFPAYYLYEMSGHDAIGLIKAQQTPVLILQGENDHQVLPDADYGLYEQALSGEPYATLKLYPGLNHAFMPSAATNLNEAVAEYNQPARIPDEVANDIAAFIQN